MRTILFCLLCAPLLASAATYRCTVDGKTLLTDRPCSQAPAAAKDIETMSAAEIQAQFEREIAQRDARADSAATLAPIAPVVVRRADNATGSGRAVSGAPATSTNWGGLLILLIIGVYLLPAAVAGMRGHHNRMAIFVLNLLLGWTAIGWIVAIVWASSAVQPSARGKLLSPDAPTPLTHVKCPDCQELIRKDAKKCRYCGCELTPVVV